MPKSKKTKGATTTSQIRRVRVDEIIVDKGKFHELNNKKISELAESISKVGLMHPVTGYIKPGWGKARGVVLVAGQHRLEAAKKLGWEFIDVVVVKSTTKQNRMRQITENLHRNDLTAAERADLVNEWVKLCEEEGRSFAHPQPHDKGISRAARTLGMSNKGVRNSKKVASIDPDARKALKRAGLNDNEKVMLEVADEEPEDQVAKVQEIVERRKKEKATAKHKRDKAKGMAKGMGKTKCNAKGKLASEEDDDSSDTPFDRLMEVWDDTPDFQEAWADAGTRDRQRFIDEVLLADDDGGDDDDEWEDDGGGRGMTSH